MSEIEELRQESRSLQVELIGIKTSLRQFVAIDTRNFTTASEFYCLKMLHKDIIDRQILELEAQENNIHEENKPL